MEVLHVILRYVTIVEAEGLIVNNIVTLVGATSPIIAALTMMVHLIVVETRVVPAVATSIIVSLVVVPVATWLAPVVVIHVLVVMLLIVVTMVVMVTFTIIVLLHLILRMVVEVTGKVNIGRGELMLASVHASAALAIVVEL